MRRRFMGIVNAPKLVKLTELGAREYVFEKGYKYADLLVVGGGGKGGMNSGGGGGHGLSGPGGQGGPGIICIYYHN